MGGDDTRRERRSAALDAALYCEEPVERDAARALLRDRADLDTVNFLLRALEAPTRRTRRRAERILAELSPSLIRSPLAAALLQRSETTARARAVAARILASIAPGPEPALGPGLTDPEARVRKASANHAAPTEALISALLDPDPEVAQRAAQVLEEREAPLPEETLRRALSPHSPPPPALMRIAARHGVYPQGLDARTLGGTPRLRAHLRHRPTLLEIFAGAEPGPAAWLLGELGALPATAPGHPDPLVRAAAARWGIPGETGPEATARLQSLQEDPAAEVRWLAARAAAGAYTPQASARSLAPHDRADAPSAQPPYGLRHVAPGDLQRPAPADAILALSQPRQDVNLGTAIRSAEAAGLAEVWVVGHAARHSGANRGTETALPIRAFPDDDQFLDAVRSRGFQLVGVQQTPESQPYHRAIYPPRPIFVLGSERTGLSARLRRNADLLVEIPLFGVIDSLNVSAAATCVLFHWRLSAGASPSPG